MKRVFTLLTGAFVSVCSLFGQSNIYEPIQMDTALRYGILENGLTYYIRHNDFIPQKADFYIVQNVGAVLEEDYQDGLAHFLEHMAFNGTKNFPDKGIITYLEKIGVKFGADINAYTAQDQTVYNLCDVPTYRKGIVDTSLMILHDWSGFLTLDSTEIDKERGVIREEWRTRSNANRRIWTKSLPILFPNSRYGERDITGDTAIINNFKPKVLREFYHKWYRPDLQAIIIVGDVDVDLVEKKIKELFVDIPKQNNPTPRPIYQVKDNDKPIIAILTDPEASQTIVSIDYRHNTLSDIQRASFFGYVTSIHHSLISSMLSDRLAEISQKPDAPFVMSYTEYGNLVRSKDVFELIAMAKEGKEQQTLDTLLKEAERMDKYGFTESELERAKIELFSMYERLYNERNNLSNNSYVREYVNNYLDFEPVPGIEWEYKTIQNILPQINIDVINKTAKLYVSDKNMTVFISAPEKNEKSLPSESDILSSIEKIKSENILPYVDNFVNKSLISSLNKKGKIKKEESIEKYGLTKLMLSNGATVIIKPTKLKENEILINAYSKGGLSLIENDDDIPTATLASSIYMNNGLGDFNQMDLSKQLAGKKAYPTPSIGGYSQSLSGSTTIKDLETMLQMYYLYFTTAREDNDAFESTLNKYKSILENKYLDPNKIFNDTIQNLIYNNNPRVKPLNISDLNGVNQKNAIEIFRKFFSSPENFTFYIVGNVDINELKPLLCKYIASIPKGKTEKKWVDRGIRKISGKNSYNIVKSLNIDKASNFIIYNGNLNYSLENKVALSMLSDILYTRYFESMREDEGGTYGAHVSARISNIPIEEANIQIVFDTDPKLESKLLSIVRSEIEKIMTEGPLEKDLMKVKENFKSRYASNQKSNKWWLNVIMQYFNDDIDLSDDYIKIVEKMDGEKIKSVLKSIIEQNNETIIVLEPNK